MIDSENETSLADNTFVILLMNMDINILNVLQEPLVDNSITELEYHTYQPFVSSSFEYNDECRMGIMELDTYTFPSQSFLYIEGKLTEDDGGEISKLQLINNAFSYLFRDIRYELNGVVIDSVRNVGLTSTLKGYLSNNDGESIRLQNAGWFPKEKTIENVKNFNVCIPLNILMGIFEDYKEIMIKIRKNITLFITI